MWSCFDTSEIIKSVIEMTWQWNVSFFKLAYFVFSAKKKLKQVLKKSRVSKRWHHLHLFCLGVELSLLKNNFFLTQQPWFNRYVNELFVWPMAIPFVQTQHITFKNVDYRLNLMNMKRLLLLLLLLQLLLYFVYGNGLNVFVVVVVVLSNKSINCVSFCS